jgi:sulfide:quinone oxidoreductase
MTTSSPHRVVIAGGGIGGLETMLALRSLAGDRVDITLLAPEPTFHVRALSVTDPFAGPIVRTYEVARLCVEAGAEFVGGRLASVRPEERAVETASGGTLQFDDLVLAVGARRRAPFESGIVFRGLEDAEAVHGLVQDVELGYSDSVAFVVPTGAATWPLPLYELALLMASRAFEMSVTPRLVFITPEERPLGVFGLEAAATVRELLDGAGIELRTETHVRALEHGTPIGLDGSPLADTRRAVTVPLLEGPRVPGLPADPGGFLPVDERGAVLGLPGVWAVGDATTSPLKQGGLAARQAGAVAAAIAAAAGAEATSAPVKVDPHAKLLTGGRPAHLGEVTGDGDAKVATRYLGPVLARLDRVATA